MSEQKFHPALSITNVKSLIPITLDNASGQYHSWAALFKVQARVHNLLNHIIPPTDEKAKKKEDELKAADPDLWDRLDAAVLQWIYGTISQDLLLTILTKDDSAAKAWKRLENIFQDNKHSRAVHLENEFSTTNFEDFADVDAYCTRLKLLADQLADVDAPVSNSRLVLKMIGGLTDEYAGYVTIIQNQDPLPEFETARSRLKMEETTIKKRAARESGGSTSSTALITSSNGGSDNGYSSPTQQQNRNINNNKGKKNNRGKGGNNRGRGSDQKTGRSGRQQGGNSSGSQQTPQHWQQRPTFWGPQQQWQPMHGQWSPQWAAPPCPYPTVSWQQPRPVQPRQPGVLGPRPSQAYMAAPSMVGCTSNYAPSYAPTDIDAAMHTLSLSQPDGNWYMDTGATSHMTADQGFTDGDHSNEV